uniref:Uncharacterized protein n=1 Tax=Cyphia bulbosa var. bulbosa TaxID=2041115 RepID=A0A291F3E9_9ASTR|nr:hypothetical protein Cyp_bu_bu1Pt1081 [Cyphia bulbosa var. bulbosa]ATG26664.1 hypothetical protein Cyp_bu_bu1Pt1437 [Cyphia bulbosa var. bulbosa]
MTNPWLKDFNSNSFGLIFFIYSVEYLRKLLYYQRKWLESVFNAKMAMYNRTLLEEEKNSLILREYKIQQELAVQYSRQMEAFASKNYNELIKLIAQTASMKKRRSLMRDQFFFIVARCRQNKRDQVSLAGEIYLIDNARQVQFLVYEEKCRKNAIAKAFFDWLNRADLKIRQILLPAIYLFSRYLNEVQKSNSFGLNYCLYSLEYLLKVVFYALKWLYNSFNAKRVFSERSFLERALELAKDYKFNSKVLAFKIAKMRLEDGHPDELAKLQDNFDNQFYSRKEEDFAHQKQLSFLKDRWQKNERAAESLLEERNLIENTLEAIFFVYQDKCRKNAFAIAFITGLQQNEGNLRKRFYAALNGQAWDNK